MTTLETPAPPHSTRSSTSTPRSLQREQDAIFAPLVAARRARRRRRRPGSFLTAQVGAESVLVVRGDDGELRAFRNVCRHRAARLREGRGECGKALRCPYHGWTYRTDGRLIGVPEGRGFDGLDKSALPLMPARVETFAGLVFVTLDPDAPPLHEPLAGLEDKLAPYRLDTLTRFSESTHVPAGELEDRRRQLPRGLPHPDRPPEPDAAARLPALHGRDRRRLGLGRGAAARRSRRATGSSAPTSGWCARCPA